MGEYKGDSPAKKFARARQWIHFRRIIGQVGMRNGSHLVLAGHGGDVMALMAMGADPFNVTAVDMDETCLDFCESREHVRDAQLVCSDVFRYTRDAPWKYDTAFLDFCCTASVGLAKKMARMVVDCMEDGSAFGFGIMYGRESAATLRSMRDTFAERDAEFDKEFFHRASHPHIREELASGCDTPLAEMDPGLQRAAAMVDWINQSCMKKKVALITRYMVSYFSKTKDSGGVPMVYVVAKVMRREGAGVSRAGFAREAWRVLNHSMADPETRPRMDVLGKMTEAELRRRVVQLAEEMDPHAVSAILDIPTRTIGAWRAHQTMGTYGETQAP